MNAGETFYWETRYSQEFDKDIGFKLFDWYVPFSDIYLMVESVLDPLKKQKILIIGVGRSNIIDTLYAKGHRDITAIDISPTLINELQKKYSTFSGVDFMVMDVRDLSFLSGCAYSLVLDKACLDALFCLIDFKNSVEKALQEIYRVMRVDGIFLSFTHAPKLARCPYLRGIKWSIDAAPVIGGGEGLSMFTMVKTSDRELLARQIAGNEVTSSRSTSGVVTGSELKARVRSMKKIKGFITVTEGVDAVAHMVAETAELDG